MLVHCCSILVQIGFDETRMRRGCQKLLKARGTSTQGRLDSFFKVISTTSAKPGSNKRPAAEEKKGNAAKKSRGGGAGGGGRGARRGGR